jgi:CheY-like chemotaxis protein
MDGPKSRVLVVDDDWMNREVMEAHLLGAGYDVLVAHSGLQALELAQATPPDVVLLDVRMQGMSGYEVCRQLKAQPATQFSPVVIVSALENEDHKQQALAAGADDFVAKPFTSLMLLTRVRNMVRLKRLHDELEKRDRLLQHILGRPVDGQAIDVLLAEHEN